MACGNLQNMSPLLETDDKALTNAAITPISSTQPLCRRRFIFEDEDNLSFVQNKLDTPDHMVRKFRRSQSMGNYPQSSLKALSSNIISERKRDPICIPTSERIMRSVEEISENENLIGDGTKAYSLPSFEGRHKGLRYISQQTVRDLIENRYSGVIENYQIIDCRYPYEYTGGHIKDATNLHTQEMVNGLLNNYKECSKTVLIFHCEFSSERAPKLLKYLRNKDRELNAENYPNLFYPEIYLLSGGYKEFYENQQESCTPQVYIPMLKKEHSSELRHFRSKSKSWNGFERRKCIRF